MLALETSVSLDSLVLKLNVYHPFTGVTNNQSECSNSTLQQLQNWKEVPVDSWQYIIYKCAFYT